MTILIIAILILIVLMLNFLRIIKYRKLLEPNAEAIVDLINGLKETEKNMENQGK